MYESLTRHIGKISWNTAGTVITDHSGDGTPERPYQMPFVSYSSEVEAFVRDIYAFEKAHRELKLNDYQEILERNGIRWDMRSMTQRALMPSASSLCSSEPSGPKVRGRSAPLLSTERLD